MSIPTPSLPSVLLEVASSSKLANLLLDIFQRIEKLEENEKARSTRKPKQRKYSEPLMPCGVCGSTKTYWIKRGSPEKQYMVTRCECGKTSNRKNISGY